VLSVAATFAADFNTGQAARALIGQPQFTRQDATPSDTVIGSASGVAFANNTLFVADSNHIGASPSDNRVLIFNNISDALKDPTAQWDYTQRCPVCVGQANVVLGQTNFTTIDPTLKPTRTGLRNPTAVASDGVHLVVADTDSNRVLIWNTIPTQNNQPADLVLGQPDFTTSTSLNPPSAKSMSGPEGVWLQGGKLFVADTHNNRVLIWNSIPTSNDAAADVVLGQGGFNVGIQNNLAQITPNPQANSMSDPVSVTSDGQRLYVTDLGYSRILIFNRIPTSNGAAADVVIGQPDMVSAIDNNSSALCPSNGTDSNNNPTYPPNCLATVSFPRFALSDGNGRLFIADGGNDRILVFNSIPTHNGQTADYVLGQIGGDINQASDDSNSLRAPVALAWDGTNLYCADTYNRRITVYSPANQLIPYTGVRNAASLEIFAVASVVIGGTIQAKDTVTVTINGTNYKYEVTANDTLSSIVTSLVGLINAGSGDPNAFALPDLVTNTIVLSAKISGTDGNNITIATSVSNNAQITATASGANFSGGGDAAQIAPGTLVSIEGSGLSDTTATADPNADTLPTTLANTQVYFDGVRAPLMFVSPDRITAQVPFEFLDTTSINAWVRTVRQDGTVVVSTPVAVSIVTQNPGIFAQPGDTDPRVAMAVHSSSAATGTVSVDGTANAGDTATVNIEDRTYTYTVQSGDTLDTIRDALIALINQDPKVTATAAGLFDRIRLKARVEGPDGNGILYTATASPGAQVIMTATTPALCCANVAGAPITNDNPAQPGETIIVYATGLGTPINPENLGINTGSKYHGDPNNQPVNFVSSLAGGKTANVLYSGLAQNQVGIYEVDLELNSGLPTDLLTQVTIAQDVFVSNIVTVPVVNPNPASVTSQ
jgi:uncharacterized protein (TIGR03437 family)